MPRRAFLQNKNS